MEVISVEMRAIVSIEISKSLLPKHLFLFQIRPMGRRGGERRRGEGAGADRQALGVRGTREVQGTADADTAIYLEIL